MTICETKGFFFGMSLKDFPQENKCVRECLDDRDLRTIHFNFMKCVSSDLDWSSEFKTVPALRH